MKAQERQSVKGENTILDMARIHTHLEVYAKSAETLRHQTVKCTSYLFQAGCELRKRNVYRLSSRHLLIAAAGKPY